MIKSGKRPDFFYTRVQLCVSLMANPSYKFVLLDAIDVVIYPMDDEAFSSGNADGIYTMDDTDDEHNEDEHLASGVLHDLLAQALRASPHWPAIRALGARNARGK